MSEKKVRYRALKGLTLPDGEKTVRVEEGEMVPARLNETIPEVWVGSKVEEA